MAKRKTDWGKIGAWATIVAVVVAIVFGLPTIWPFHHEAKPAPPATATSSGAQTVTASDGGSATSSVANGPGNQVGNGNINNSNNVNLALPPAKLSLPPPGERENELDIITVLPNGTRQIVQHHFVPSTQPKAILALPKQIARINFFFENTVKDIRRKKYLEAMTSATRVIAQSPEDAGAYNNRAIARFGLGDFQGAFADWKTATKLQPQNAVLHKNFAAALGWYATGRRDEVSILTDVMDQTVARLKDPSNTAEQISDIWNDVAIAWLGIANQTYNTSEYPLALYDASQANAKALRFNLSSASAHSVHALLVFEARDMPAEAAAVDEVKAAALAEPDNPIPYFFLAQYYGFVVNDRDQCYINLKKTLSLAPGYANNFRIPNNHWLTLCDEPRFKALILGSQNGV